METLVADGRTLQKQSIMQVQSDINRYGTWHGILVGDDVAQRNFFGGFPLACEQTFTSQKELSKAVDCFEYYLNTEQGKRSFYKIIGGLGNESMCKPICGLDENRCAKKALRRD